MRREFKMPEEDEEYLNSRGAPWEAVLEVATKWIILEGFTVPAGYKQTSVTAAIRIQPAYPDVDIDMVYFYPALELNTGKAIPNVSLVGIDGKQFQQWSRHRTGTNPWRPGVDTVGTHMLQVESWLVRELNRA